MLQSRTTGTVTYYVSPLLEAQGVRHAFSTRTGGVSPPPFDSLNLGIAGEAKVRDASENLEENYRRLRQAIGCEALERCWVTQVHGAGVCEARRGAGFENGACADAMVSDDPGRVLSVKYADCVPILLAAPGGRAVAAVHAGWRGMVAGVIGAAVERLARISGRNAASIVAAIGPCIGFDAFEVGAEVLAAFAARFGVDAPLRRRDDGKGHIDLRRSAMLELQAADVAERQVDLTDRCTFTHGYEFFSHRRDGSATGRMAAIIAPAPA